MAMDDLPSLATILRAHRQIEPVIHRTPVLTSASMDKELGARLFFKCENFQKTGSFKFRGASWGVLALDPQAAAAGVVTHSSGNHAAALALAARQRGVPAHIVMPSNASPCKIAAVEAYGGRITYCEPNTDARESTARALRQQTGATLIHPYDDYRTITAQGTAVVELHQQASELDLVIVPTGGGGLLAGTLLASKELRPDAQVIGAEPAGADDAYRSWKEGRLVPLEKADTVADGLRTGLGKIPFLVIRDRVDAMALADDRSILRALEWIVQRLKIVVEPSAAVALAVLMEGSVRPQGRRVGIVLTGGNVDLSTLAAQLGTVSA